MYLRHSDLLIDYFISGQLENNRIRGLLLKDLKGLRGNSLLGKTINSEILKNCSGWVRVAKMKFESGRVAGTRQCLLAMLA